LKSTPSHTYSSLFFPLSHQKPQSVIWTTKSTPGSSSEKHRPQGTVPHHLLKKIRSLRSNLDQRYWIYRPSTGLVSEGRIDKDTPPLTTPGQTSKSSAMDISPHIFQIAIRRAAQRLLRPSTSPDLVRYEARSLFVFM
jgi:hypothetical protein